MTAHLNPELIALIDSGVSVIVASRDPQLRPSLMRGMGSRISADGCLITVFLRPSQSQVLLADLQAGGPIAVVFSHPPTNRTVQLKASGVRIRAVEPSDQAALRRYRVVMQNNLGQLGFVPDYVAAAFSVLPGDLVAVEFTPEAAFDQTPGARAGTPLPARGAP